MKNKNVLSSFKCAFIGIWESIKKERNIKIHCVMGLMVILAGFIYRINADEWKECIMCIALVLGAEMINTAIEINTDLAMPNVNHQAKLSKDIAAGAVLVISIASAIIGLIIFIPKIF